MSAIAEQIRLAQENLHLNREINELRDGIRLLAEASLRDPKPTAAELQRFAKRLGLLR